MNGTLFSIEHGSFVDGPGIRTSVFFKGCNLKCVWCHNPESQSPVRQKLYFADKCVHCGKCRAVCPSPDHCVLCGRCAEVCPRNALEISGYEISAKEVLDEIISDKVFYSHDGGATFSGGECMLQTDFLLELLKGCKAEDIGTAVDTAGCVSWDKFEKILPYADIFLYDLKVMDPEKHQKYVGADNALILENYRKLIAAGKRVIVRMPILPGVNDAKEDVLSLRAFFDEAGWPERTELLPYHRLGENKYRALGIEPVIFEVPSAEKMEELKALLH